MYVRRCSLVTETNSIQSPVEVRYGLGVSADLADLAEFVTDADGWKFMDVQPLMGVWGIWRTSLPKTSAR
jgi:hypothetical protein